MSRGTRNAAAKNLSPVLGATGRERITRRRGGAERRRLARYAAFAVASGADPEMAGKARAGGAAHLDLRSPEDDAAVLREAGFWEVTMFYAAFTWRGRVGYA